MHACHPDLRRPSPVRGVEFESPRRGGEAAAAVEGRRVSDVVFVACSLKGRVECVRVWRWCGGSDVVRGAALLRWVMRAAPHPPRPSLLLLRGRERLRVRQEIHSRRREPGGRTGGVQGIMVVPARPATPPRPAPPLHGCCMTEYETKPSLF